MNSAKVLLLLACPSLFGCLEIQGTDCDHGKPRQCEAEQIVWRDALGCEGSPPAIEWTDHDLVKGVAGQYLTPAFGDAGIWITWDGSLSRSVFVHELTHACRDHKLGDPDNEHRSEWFGIFRDGVQDFSNTQAINSEMKLRMDPVPLGPAVPEPPTGNGPPATSVPPRI